MDPLSASAHADAAPIALLAGAFVCLHLLNAAAHARATLPSPRGRVERRVLLEVELGADPERGERRPRLG